MGTGTTGVAASLFLTNFIGFEVEKECFKVCRGGNFAKSISYIYSL
jgi:hypothetical protein